VSDLGAANATGCRRHRLPGGSSPGAVRRASVTVSRGRYGKPEPLVASVTATRSTGSSGVGEERVAGPELAPPAGSAVYRLTANGEALEPVVVAIGCQLDLGLLPPQRIGRISKLLTAEGDPGSTKHEADQSKVDEDRACQIGARQAECERHGRRGETVRRV
jgi:hypothetical protein